MSKQALHLRPSEKTKLFTILFLYLSLVVNAQKTTPVWLDDLPIQISPKEIRPVQAKSDYSYDTLRINGVNYSRG